MTVTTEQRRQGLIRVSLIVGTINRPEGLARLIKSLASQTFRDFELIVVDQSPDDAPVRSVLTSEVVAFPVRHLRAPPGLCIALNTGIREAAGDFIAFPDDDCWYAPNLLARIVSAFQTDSTWDGITTTCADDTGQPCGIRWDKKPGRITRFNVWFRGMSTGIFLKRHAIAKIGPFDETLGVGPGLLLAAHDTDYLLRAIEAGLHIHYAPEIVVGHPQMILDYSKSAIQKNYNYAIGAGRVMRKHKLPVWFVGVAIAVSAIRAALALVCLRSGEARLQWSNFTGRLRGWLHG